MMSRRSTVILLALILLSQEWSNNKVNAAKILALLALPSHSHHIWNRSLMLALANKGHQVTVVTPDPEKHPVPNLREIIVEGMYDDMNAAYDYESMSTEGYVEHVKTVFDWGIDACKSAFNSKGIRQLKDLTTRETFDLIIVEATIIDCFLGFIPEFGSPPIMAMAAYSSPPWARNLLGNPDNPSYINTYILPYPDHMSFFQRMINMLLHSFVLLTRTYYHMPSQQKIAEDFFGKTLPPLRDIEKNISVILVNIHHSIDYPQPLVPALIPVAGMHVKPSKQLPKDLQKYLDDAKEGVIYFSLGSNVRSDKLTVEKRQIILEAFSELPHKILWKWESESLPGQPKNVKIGKWLPQNDILGHPNVKLFITHSGLMSTHEATYHGVPVVGMPFLADQFVNIRKFITRGVGEMVDYNSLTKESFLAAVHKVLYTPSYTNNMKKLSELFRDRPETPLETAVYWTEYVLRHKGAHHLRSAAVDLAWYQYLLLDVILVLLSGVLLGLAILYTAAKQIYKVIAKPKKPVKTKRQ